MNWGNPQDINEKINWLKLYGDTSQWARLADKYKVREYIKEKGLESLLVPLYGVWNKVEDIDFNSLPESFVLKANNGCGDYIVVKDKRATGLESQIKSLKRDLKNRYGYYQGEYHYVKIPPKIIAEELLIQEESFSSSLIDYKVWCFGGKPYCILTCYSRDKSKVYVESYDLEWNYHPENSVFTDHFRDGGGIIPKPECLEELLDYAKILSEGFPQVRVDFYIVKGKIYFGEMTFTSAGGCMEYFTDKFLLEMGKEVSLKP